MAILVAIGIPAYNDYVNKARVARAVSDIKMLEREIISYKVDNGTFPDSLNDIGYGSLQDPWNNPYKYLNIEDGGGAGKGTLRRDRFLNPLNTDFDLYSTGADGTSQTNLNAKDSRDDVVRATNGGFVGLASYF